MSATANCVIDSARDARLAELTKEYPTKPTKELVDLLNGEAKHTRRLRSLEA